MLYYYYIVVHSADYKMHTNYYFSSVELVWYAMLTAHYCNASATVDNTTSSDSLELHIKTSVMSIILFFLNFFFLFEKERRAYYCPKSECLKLM